MNKVDPLVAVWLMSAGPPVIVLVFFVLKEWIERKRG
jgi:hypothetical protein